MHALLTRGDVEAATPVGDAGVLVAADCLAAVQDNTCALVSHAKLVGVQAHGCDPEHAEVPGGHGVAQLPSKGQHEAA